MRVLLAMLQGGLPAVVYEASAMPWHRPDGAWPPVVAQRGVQIARSAGEGYEEVLDAVAQVRGVGICADVHGCMAGPTLQGLS